MPGGGHTRRPPVALRSGYDVRPAASGGGGRAARVTARAGRHWWPAGVPVRLDVVRAALAVSVAYYVGTRIGFLLHGPSVPTSLLWPPNAILTATLLLAPVRYWWIFVAAVLPAHVAAQVGLVASPWLVGAWFVTNCSEAVIAAVVVRRLSDAPARLDTLRRVVAFIVGAGLVAPFVSCFLDASAVWWLEGDPYWLVWRTRFFANVLTALTLTPALVISIEGRRRWRAVAPWRWAEAALLAVALAGTAVGVFWPLIAIEGSPADALMLVLLPLLLWAAVRFGPLGASLALLTLALIGLLVPHAGGGPFTALPPEQRVILLQASLIMVTLPLLCLAAAILERRESETALSEALRFEALLSELPSVFVLRQPVEIDAAIRLWLGRFAEFLGLQRLVLRRRSGAGPEWYAWEGPPQERDAGTPPPFSLELALLSGGHPFGTLTLQLTNERRLRTPEWMARLTVVAEVLGGTLAKKDAEDALRASESMKSSILASLTERVAVLDRGGYVIAMNDAWSRQTCEADGGAEGAMLGEGGNYVEFWKRSARHGHPYATEIVGGIVRVLAGIDPEFSIEYPCGDTARERWSVMSVVRLNRPEGGAVVSQADVTERRLAELDAQRLRQELAHFTRVTTMGELTSSLAHELNQPLTAILANAQAARRNLDTARPDVDELRAILGDIIDDDRRAGQVIHRLRDMLSKREPAAQELYLNLLIEDVVTLLRSDLLIHNVAVVLDLARNLPPIHGDRVQLQQVVLNLLLNAVDAMADGVGRERTIVMRTEWSDGVHISVRDAGHGIAPGTHDLVFEPFYTTKPAGMGMGLVIARSIVEAHGGRIWATDNPDGGATFHVELKPHRSSSAG